MSAQRATSHLAMKIAKNLPPLENSSDFRLWEEAIVNVCHDIKASTGNQSVHNKVFEHHNQANAAPPNDDEQSHRFAMMLMKMSSGDVARTIIAAVEQRQPGANNNYALTALRELRQHFQSQQAANRQRIERDINNLSLLQFRKPEITESTAIDHLFSAAQKKRMEFTFAGGTMSESDFVRRLRNNLPREYDPAKMAVAAWDTNQDTIARNHQYLRDISDTIRPTTNTTALNGRNDALYFDDEPRRGRDLGRGGRGRGRGRSRGRGRGGEPRKKGQICFDYANGRCDRNNCRFLHVDKDSICKAYAGLQEDKDEDDHGSGSRNAAFQAEESSGPRNYLLAVGDDDYDLPSIIDDESSSASSDPDYDSDYDSDYDEFTNPPATTTTPSHRRRRPPQTSKHETTSPLHAISDSGATSHYLPGTFLRHLQNPRSVSEEIDLAVGKSVGTTRGDLNLNFYNDPSYASTFSCTLRNALIVPGLRTPLVSTAALIDDNDCPIQHFTYGNSDLSGNSTSGRTLLYGFRERRRYFIPFTLQDAAMTSAVRSESSGSMVPDTLSSLPVRSGPMKSAASSQEERQPSKSGPEEETKQQAKPFKLRSSTQEIFKLHLIFGHASLSMLRNLARQNLLQIHPDTKAILTSSFTNIDCSSCKIAKSIKLPLPSKSSPPLSRDDGIWNFDIKGPLVDSMTHRRFIGQATHAQSSWGYPFFLRQKSEAMAAIEELKNLAERDGHPIKVLRLDYGGELHSTEFEEWAKRNNIELQHSSPGNSEQNGMAERPLRTLTEGTAASLLHGKVVYSQQS